MEPEEAFGRRVQQAAAQAAREHLAGTSSAIQRWFHRRASENMEEELRRSSLFMEQAFQRAGREGMTLFVEQVAVGVTVNVVSGLLREFWKAVSYAHEKLPLRNEQLISSSLLAVSGLPTDLKNSVATLKVQVHAAIRQAASDMESGGIQSLQEALSKKALGGYLRVRADQFLNGQKQMLSSHRSVGLAVEVFQKINEQILVEIDALQQEKGDTAELMKMLLMNAIFVVEIADAAGSFLEDFNLQGVALIEQCRDAVLADIARNEELESNFAQQYMSGSESVETYREDIVLRTKFRGEVRALWDNYMKDVEGIRQNINEYKKRARELKAARDNAIIQLGFLQIVALTGLVGSNIQAAKSVLTMGEVKLKRLDDRTLYLLLGIEK